MNIRHLTLNTQDLNAQERFYSRFDGLEMERGEHILTLQFKHSSLSFRASSEQCTYHFAIDIPWGSIEDAIRWLHAHKIEILPFQGKEVVEFPSWEARAVYFYDTAHNVVEWISRKPVHHTPYGAPFSMDHLLCISEIGTPVSDVTQAAKELEARTGCLPYSEMGKHFAALGDHHGLFILVDPEHKKWLPHEDDIRMHPWTMDAEMPNFPEGIRVVYEEGVIKLSESIL